jgi:hypothetical protein
LANPNHHAKPKEGAKASNDWREADALMSPDPSHANLIGASLAAFDLAGI